MLIDMNIIRQNVLIRHQLLCALFILIPKIGSSQIASTDATNISWEFETANNDQIYLSFTIPAAESLEGFLFMNYLLEFFTY